MEEEEYVEGEVVGEFRQMNMHPDNLNALPMSTYNRYRLNHIHWHLLECLEQIDAIISVEV